MEQHEPSDLIMVIPAV